MNESSAFWDGFVKGFIDMIGASEKKDDPWPKEEIRPFIEPSLLNIKQTDTIENPVIKTRGCSCKKRK